MLQAILGFLTFASGVVVGFGTAVALFVVRGRKVQREMNREQKRARGL